MSEISALPIPSVLVRKLALRFVQYDDKRAQFFLRRELEQIACRRLSAGVPEAIVAHQCAQLETAVWSEILRLEAETNGGAA
ncbi:DUF6074 family protein [Microvirga sesbaniae]|uniref:DUF6074 family protein n=1 Tax=Microvirga sesbaniae TaxID=681392 RepID=UPI0021CAA85F|nr:DUF6074 family protein [Microvirga sp. HBU67692]